VIRLTRSQPGVLLVEREAPPRVIVCPPPTRTNSWEDVSDLSRSFGLVLDGWQELILQSSLGERSNGTWAAKRVSFSVRRQNGKSQLLVARALAGVLLFGEKKIVISAHQQDTARETFQKFLELIDESPALAARVSQIMNALNREFIKFTNGAIIQFKARSSGGTRGFSCDCLMLDEAQILSRRAWASINSTMSARKNPQVWLLGTPPQPEDDSDVFVSVRRSALDGKSTTAAYLEWSADPEDDPELESTRAKANPAWNIRINHEVVQGEYETYTPDQFAIERLGIWPDDMRGAGVISAADWSARLDPTSTIAGDPVLVLDVSPMATHACIVAGGMSPDGRPHVEITSDGSTLDYRPGTDWAVSLLGAAVERRGSVTVWIVQGSAAEALVPRLAAVGVSVEFLKRADYAAACVQFASDLPAHLGQKPLTDAVLAGVKKGTDEGLWMWGRVKSSTDITPLVGATAAAWLASSMNINADPLSSFK